MRLIDFFESEYRPRRLIGKSENSSRLYRLSISALSRLLGRDATLDDLTNETILRLMQARLDGKFTGKSRGTANKDRCQLLAIWRMAARLNFVDRWPEVPILTEPERVPKAWTRDDLATLFATIDKQQGDLNGIPANLWWRCIVMVALDTAERIGAVFPARWDWLEDRWLHIPAEVRKGSRRDRKYFLSPQTCELLGRIRECRADKERIFAWPYGDTYLWYKYSKILVQARLPHGRQDKFHRLRKTTASVIHAAGMDAQEALDHQHRRTTRRYIDPRYVRESKPSDILAEFLRSPATPAQPEPRKRRTG